MLTQPLRPLTLPFLLFCLLWLAAAVGAPAADLRAAPPADPAIPYTQFLPLLERGSPLRDYRALATSNVDGDSEIFALRGDGSALTRLTENEVADEEPQWSPDGAWVLWVQYAGVFPNTEYDNLWIMQSDGGNPRPLTGMAGLERGSWSPDGAHIFFYNRAETGDLYSAFTLYSATPDSEPTLILEKTYLSDYAWSPDGSRLLLMPVRRSDDGIVTDLYTVAADGSDLRLIAQAIRAAAWSPDGAWLAFDAERTGGEDVYLARPDGSGLTRLTDNRMDDRLAGWVEGGARLLVRRANGDWALSQYDLYPAKGGAPAPFIEGGPDADYVRIQAIAPDGASVAYTVTTNQGYQYLYWQPTTASAGVRISPATCVDACGVRSVSWSEDGRRLAYALWQQPVPRIFNSQVYYVTLDSETPAYHLLDDDAAEPVWLPGSPYLALDAAPHKGDASVRVPHIASTRSHSITRIPFEDDADFTPAQWRYAP